MPRYFDPDGYCLSCGYKRRRPADLSCSWPGRHNVGRVSDSKYVRVSPTAPFDPDGYCRSCGYRRTRDADAGCAWPTKHDAAASDFAAQVAALYGTGKSIERVADALGSTYNLVRKALVDAGVERRTLSEAWSGVGSTRFDRGGRCRSCGYGRERPPDEGCLWPESHTPQQ